MQPDTAHIPSIENLFDLSENTRSLIHDGRELSLDWFKGYQSKQTPYHSRYILIDHNIFIIVSSGTPNPLDIKMAGIELQKIHETFGHKDLEVIWDIRHIKNLTIRVRKGIIQTNRKLSKYWKNRYLIAAPKHKTLLRLYNFIKLYQLGYLNYYGSISEAVDSILSDRSSMPENDYPISYASLDRESLVKKSKEELIELVEKYQKSHKESTDKVFEAIGQISWEGKFKNVDIQVSEDDLHFELLNAFSLLQEDLGEIIKEYKELNQNLELKVAERIVDFIDKESNLRSILDNSDSVTFLVNSRFELIDFNHAFSDEIRRRYHKTPQLNQNVLELVISEAERKVWKERLESALNGKPGIYLDQDTYNEYERVLEIKTFPINEIGKIKGISVFIEDITELKDSQFKLIEKNRDLQKVNSELDSFVYRVSHDLRAPLTSILGLISLMKIETNHEKVGEYISLQERSIQKLDLFIKEIINLSRNSRLGITVSQINFKVLLDEIFEGQSYTKKAEQTERICEIEEGIELYTDRQRLSIILNNLISNSLKYANPHEEPTFVKVKAYNQDDNCIIEVSDNGIGISEQYLPKIFEMFFRATQEFSGSGLGLYIVKETVEKLKGKISVKSKMRQGTTFKVSIPNMKDRFDSAPKLDD